MEEKWSEWGPEKIVTAEMISRFADVTDNHQWIHEDTERTRQESPYDCQIAHGLLLLSLIPSLLPTDEDLPPHTVRVIRGFDKIRLPSPVYPGEVIHAWVCRIKTYVAASGKGVIVERTVDVWSKKGKTPAVTCVLKMQYF